MSTTYTPYTSLLISLGITPSLLDTKKQSTARAIVDSGGKKIYQLIYGQYFLNLLPPFTSLPFFPNYFNAQTDIQNILASNLSSGYLKTITDNNTDFFRNEDELVFAPITVAFSAVAGSSSDQIVVTLEFKYPDDEKPIFFNPCPFSSTTVDVGTDYKVISDFTFSATYEVFPFQSKNFPVENYYYPSIQTVNDSTIDVPDVKTTQGIYKTIQFALYAVPNDPTNVGIEPKLITTFNQFSTAVSPLINDRPDNLYCVLIGTRNTSSENLPDGIRLLYDPSLIQGYTELTFDPDRQISKEDLNKLINTISNDFNVDPVYFSFKKETGAASTQIIGLIRIPITSKQASLINIQQILIPCVMTHFKKRSLPSE